MKKYKSSGQAMAEFAIIAPVLMFFLLIVFRLADIAIKSQKLEMASYYAARIYSKESIRGIKFGTTVDLVDARQSIINGFITDKVQDYLGSDKVVLRNYTGNRIDLYWPVELKFGIGDLSVSRNIILKASAEMENDPLQYGGGRCEGEVLGG